MTIEQKGRSRAWALWTGLALALVVAGLWLAEPWPSRALAPAAVNVTKTVSPTSFLPGDPAPKYTVTFQNTGGAPVTLNRITDTLPSGFTFISMAPGDQVGDPVDAAPPDIVWAGSFVVPGNGTLKMVYAVLPNVPRRQEPYTNSVQARAGMTAIGPDSADLWVGAADLSVAKTASKTRLVHGETVDYTVVFANDGEIPSTLTVITDTLGPMTDFVQMLPGSDVGAAPNENGQVLTWPGSRVLNPGSTLTLKYRVDTMSTAGWLYPCNRAEAWAGSRVGPEDACVEVGPDKVKSYLPVIQRDYEPARFTIAKTVTPGTVNDLAGQVVTYTVTFANVGDERGTVASVADNLPPGFSFLSMAAGSDVIVPPSGTMGTITWTGPWQINPGQQMRLIYRVSPVQAPGQYWNLATLNVSRGTPPPSGAAALVTVERGVLLEDNFDDGIGRWTKFLNYWRLRPEQWYWGQAEGVNGTGAAGHHCAAGVPNPDRGAEDALLMYLGSGAEQWTDYRVEVKMYYHDAVGSDPIGLWVRGQYEDVGAENEGGWVTGYYIIAGGKPDGANHYVRLAQLQTVDDCVAGGACDNPQNLYDFNNPYKLHEVSMPGAFARDRWYTLAVEVRGNVIRAYWNGELAFEYTDNKAPFLTGTVGLKTYKGEWIDYDDIVVTPLN